MKYRKLLSGILSLSVVCTSITPNIAFANEGVVVEATDESSSESNAERKGSITLSVSFSLPQTKEKVASRNLKLKVVNKDSGSSKEIILSNNTDSDVVVTELNVLGEQITTESRIGAYKIEVNNLPVGEYKLELTGDGYVTASKDVTLDKYSQFVQLDNANGSYSIGDVNGDNIIDNKDLDLISSALKTNDTSLIDKYDLNGDDKVDIVDLTYANMTKGVSADIISIDTVYIDVPEVDTTNLNVEGDISDIFEENNVNPVILSSASENTPIELDMNIPDEGVELSEINIVAPQNDGGIEGGKIIIETESGELIEQPFGNHNENAYVEQQEEVKEETIVEDNEEVPAEEVESEVSDSVETPVEEVESETIESVEEAPAEEVESSEPILVEDSEVTNAEVSQEEAEEVHYLLRNADENVININLEKRVVVKRVTIQVTKVVGEDGTPDYASVSRIEFIKNIVPEGALEDTTKVNNVSAKEKDGEIELIWSAVNNVEGYTVRYGTSKDNLTSVATTNTNSIVIDGLDNNVTYYFSVTATSNGWAGTASDIISATPLPSSVPGLVSNINVEAADGRLTLKWNEIKNAVYYQVFYREKGASEFINFGDNLVNTTATITNLTNGVTYEIAIKAGNTVGLGEYSEIIEATPKVEEIELPKFPENGRLNASEIIESIKMTNSNNVDKTLCPNFDVSHLIDDNANTYWVAAKWWESSDITYTFKTPQKMNYLLFAPYLNGNHKTCISHYNITARDENGNVLFTLKNKAVSSLNADNYIIVKFPETDNIKSITLGLAEKAGGGARVSISEIAFYESSSLANDIAALFKDGAFTQLADGVDEAKIVALEEQLNEMKNYYIDVDRLADEIKLAKALLNNSTDIGVIVSDFASRSTSADSSKFSQTASDLQPLGVSVNAGATVAVYADIPEGESAYVVPTQYYGEAGIWRGSAIKIESGRNYITIPKIGNLQDTRGGALYLTYSGDKASEIKVHVIESKDVFKTPFLELKNWYDLNEATRKEKIANYITELKEYMASLTSAGVSGTALQTSIKNATEISTPNVLLSLPADQVLSGLNSLGVASVEEMTQKMYNNILAWEETMFVANKIQSNIPAEMTLDEYQNPMSTRQNIRYMRMFDGAFMYAAGNHVGVGYGSTSPLVQGRPTSITGEEKNGLFGWGIGHEIGHNMDKLGRAEITNNIYSIALQSYDGNDMSLETRLSIEDRWEKIFNKVAQARPGEANDVFVQLGMYWQLHLAYDNAESPLKFYNDFFKLWKAGEYSTQSYNDRFALVASKVANKNLTEYFTRWGMELSDYAKSELAKYEKEDRAIWYLNDESRLNRIANTGVASGSTTVSASVKDNEVTLVINNTDSENILGYEVIRNGVSLGFTRENVYTDNVGAANNMTYTYEVIPVDLVGNMANKVKSNEVRVAYDKTISEDLYSKRFENDVIVLDSITSDSAITTTGLKITDLASEKDITIKVKTDANGEFVTVKEGITLNKDNNVIYFNKPGTTNSTIWVYDVYSVMIEGLTNKDIDLANVQLLDYPGDRVDFYEGAMAGKLGSDFVYGENPEDVIPAGTLVVLGTYRGDPVYNYVAIEAEYNTTAEAEEANGTTTIKRNMNGYSLLLAEIPEDGAVSDISDGIFIFVPDLEAEGSLNAEDGVTDELPLDIRAIMYRTDKPGDDTSKRETSQTLWVSFPDESTLPTINFESSVTGKEKTKVKSVSSNKNTIKLENNYKVMK